MSDEDNERTLDDYYSALQKQLRSSLDVTIVHTHPVAKGDESELNWWEMLGTHLPARYQVVEKAFVLDHTGASSEEIDLLLCDRQYSPLVLKTKARTYVPAEAVYAAFEVKPETNRKYLLYAAEKVASVRKLQRTSGEIVHAGGTYEPRDPAHILGGLLATRVGWADGLGKSFKKALVDQTDQGRLDLGCSLSNGGWQATYGDNVSVTKSAEHHALVFFLFRLLDQLRSHGTVTAMELDVWGKFIELE